MSPAWHAAGNDG